MKKSDVTRYLISRHIDVFYLIDKGIAIKLEIPETIENITT